MARRKDEAPAEENQNEAPEESAEVETAPGEPGDVIDARLQQQEQGDDAVDAEGAEPGVDESEFDKDAEAEAQHANVVGSAQNAALRSGPTQDELNPAYSAPTKQ